MLTKSMQAKASLFKSLCFGIYPLLIFFLIIDSPITAFAFQLNSPNPVCNPSPTGSPFNQAIVNNSCAGNSPATQGNTSGIMLGAGNPVHLVTGNKYQQETDLPALPGVLGIEIIRHYNSGQKAPGILGANWRLSYETTLQDTGKAIHIVQADGTRLSFTRQTNQPQHCGATDPARGWVEITPLGSYRWHWQDGRVLTFNPQGDLTQIVLASGEQLDLTRDEQGKLIAVRDPQGRILKFIYSKQSAPERKVIAIETPLGTFYYQHQSTNNKSSNLIAAINTVGWMRIYHYEDPRFQHALTGMSNGYQASAGLELMNQASHSVASPLQSALQNPPQRIATWQYDEQGRVNYYLPGNNNLLNNALLNKSSPADTKIQPPASGSLQFLYLQKASTDGQLAGKTQIIDALGRKTEFISAAIAGEWRILSVIGPGCSSCGETNVSYQYDKQGRLTEKKILPFQFKGTEEKDSKIPDRPFHVQAHFQQLYQYDAQGRLTLYQDSTGAQQKYKYTGLNPKPSQIVQTSMIQPHSHTINNLNLNNKNAKTSHTEKFFEEGDPHLEHQINFSYNNYGQLIEVSEQGWTQEFSLTNHATINRQARPITRATKYQYKMVNNISLLSAIDGPIEGTSDTVYYEYNSTGQLEKITYPEQLFHSRLYNQIGQLIQEKTPAGLTIKTAYDKLGRASQIRFNDQKNLRFEYTQGQTSLGNLAKIFDEQGLLWSVQYDTTDRPLARWQRGNTLTLWQRDAVDRLVEQNWLMASSFIIPDQPSENKNSLQRKVRIDYSEHNPFEIRYTDPHGNITEIIKNNNGLPQEIKDSLGRKRQFYYDSQQSLVQIEDSVDPNQDYPWHTQLGKWTRKIDHHQANLDHRVLPGGAEILSWYDDFNRVIARQTAESGLTTYRYNNASQLVHVRYADQRQQVYRYDALGRIIERQQENLTHQTITTHIKYQGVLPIRLEHPNETIDITYNAEGLISSKNIARKNHETEIKNYLYRYQYNPNGLLVKRTEPDGNSINYYYDKKEQLQTISLQPYNAFSLLLETLARLLNNPKINFFEQILIDQVSGDSMGISQFRYGNGIRTHRLRTPEGNLGLLAYVYPNNDEYLAAWQYRYDKASRLTGIKKIDQAKVNEQSFYYDAADRLVLNSPALEDQQANHLHPEFFYYDAGFNRLTKTDQPLHPIPFVAEGTGFAHEDFGMQCKAQNAGGSMTPSRLCNAAMRPQDRSQASIFGYEGYTPFIAEQNPSIAKVKTQLEIHYDAAQRPDLIKIVNPAKPYKTLTYKHNASGERIERLVKTQEDTQEKTGFLYDQRRMVAELNHHDALKHRYIYLGQVPIARIDGLRNPLTAQQQDSLWYAIKQDFFDNLLRRASDQQNTALEIRYLHVDHRGAVVAVTHGTPASTSQPPKILWQAQYSSFGKISHLRFATINNQPFTFWLRMPGQREDEDTGLYDNNQRDYDPNTGSYLTADPLGHPDSPNAYAYVANRPIDYIDPLGLIMFAFDGTMNGNPPPDLDDFSNVYKFSLFYNDNDIFYMNGVGLDDRDTGIKTNRLDPLNANTARSRVNSMLTRLDNYLATHSGHTENLIPIDVIGFSRGAAMARDFANKVAQGISSGSYRSRGACLQLRFIGLWDTVAQFGINGRSNNQWQLSIPTQAEYVAHAVALNEHRYEFPAESILPYPGFSSSSYPRVERSFLGAHADIGGSYAEGDLSDVALVWMVEQAKKAGVQLKELAVEFTKITNPLIHDDNMLNTERQFRYRDQSGKITVDIKQSQAAVPSLDILSAKRFTRFDREWQRDAYGNKNIRAIADMQRYGEWLSTNYGIDVL